MNTEDTTPTNGAADGVTPASARENASATENASGSVPGTERPFGFWITAVDRLLRAEFATAFEREGIARRDWRLLNLVDGTVPADRPLRVEKLRRVVELGWVAPDGDGWALTDEGRTAKDRLGAIVDDIRARVAAALDPEEFAVMASSLERIARELGWHEGMRLPRTGRGRRGLARFARHAARHGFGPGTLPGPHGEGHGLPHAAFPHTGFGGDHHDAHPGARHDGPADGRRGGHLHSRHEHEGRREHDSRRKHAGRHEHERRTHRGRHGLPGHGFGPNDGGVRHLHIHLHD